MAWQFILTDLHGNVHGELHDTYARKVTLPHMRLPSATVSLPIGNSFITTLSTEDTLLKAYRTEADTTKTLAFLGPVVSSEEVASESQRSVEVVAAGPFWRVNKRVIGRTNAGFSQGIPTAVDLGLAAHNILDTINGEGFTGIGKGSRSAVTTGSFGPWHLKNAAEAISELTAGLNSFEFVVDPVEPQSEPGGVGGWPRIGNMRIAPTIGVERPDAVFEYGTDRPNVEEYKRSISREGMITRAIVSVSGWPDSTKKLPIVREDATALAAHGLLEDVVPDADVSNDALRTSIADFHLLYRKNPRELITFTPAIGMPPTPLVDYVPGDTVRARAIVEGSTRFDALFRIWGISFEIDQNGNEKIDLELIRP